VERGRGKEAEHFPHHRKFGEEGEGGQKGVPDTHFSLLKRGKEKAPSRLADGGGGGGEEKEEEEEGRDHRVS